MEEHFKPLKINGAIAILDVLGFGSRTHKLTIEEMEETFIKPLFFCLCYAADIVFKPSYSTTIGEPIRGWFFYADTAIFYIGINEQTTCPTPKEAVCTAAYFCSIVSAMCIWFNLPLRGAIDYGEFAICENPIYILGRPIIEAHNFEISQNWAGISLCENAAKQITEQNPSFLTYYPVPFKSGKKNNLCVNWPGQCIKAESKNDVWGNYEIPLWDQCFNSPKDEVQMKKANTIAFFEEYNNINAGHAIGPDLKVLLDGTSKFVFDEMYKWQPRIKWYL
jgi:hypothetical protein